MGNINTNQTVNLSGSDVNDNVGTDTLSWGGGYINTVDAYADDLGGSPYSVTINLGGQEWGVGTLRINSDTDGGVIINAVTLNDATTGEADDDQSAGFDQIAINAAISTNLTFIKASFDRLEMWGISDDTVALGSGYYQWLDLGEGDDDVTTGEGGAEFIFTAEGEDTVTIGGTGDIAYISTGQDDDVVNAEDGRVDYITTNSGHDTVNITDTSIGVLTTQDGNDKVNFLSGAMGGAELINLGDGDNELNITDVGQDFGIDSVTAFEGNDTVVASGHEWGYIISMNLNEGNNTVTTGISIDSLLTEDGTDTLTVQDGARIATARLGGGNDTVTVDAGGNIDLLDVGEGVNDVTVNGNINMIKSYNGSNTVTIADGSGVGFISFGADDSSYTNKIDVGDTSYAQSITLGNSNDTVTVGVDTWVETIEVGQGTNTITIKAGGGSTSVRGSNGSTTLNVMAGGYIDSVNLYSNQNYVDNGGVGSTVNANGYISSIFFGRAVDTLNIGAEGIGFANTGRGNDIINISEATQADYSSLVSGAEDTDTVSFSTFTSGVKISLATSAYNQTDHGAFALIDVERLVGTGFADTLTGAKSTASELKGGAGADTYYVTSSLTVVNETGGGGTDTVKSANISINLSFASKFQGNVENAALDGASSLNLTGNSLANTLTGNSGENIIDGKGGNDTLIGGAGKDDFQFTTNLNAGTNVDTITGYNVADDRIVLENAVFTVLPSGWLFGSAFQSNSTGTATTAAARIIYDNNSGELYYDKDGIGGAAGVQFADLDGNPALTKSDFFVI